MEVEEIQATVHQAERNIKKFVLKTVFLLAVSLFSCLILNQLIFERKISRIAIKFTTEDDCSESAIVEPTKKFSVAEDECFTSSTVAPSKKITPKLTTSSTGESSKGTTLKETKEICSRVRKIPLDLISVNASNFYAILCASDETNAYYEKLYLFDVKTDEYVTVWNYSSAADLRHFWQFCIEAVHSCYVTWNKNEESVDCYYFYDIHKIRTCLNQMKYLKKVRSRELY